MFRVLSFIGVYKEARKYSDLYVLCDSKTDKHITWLISQLSQFEYEQLRNTLDHIYQPTEPDELRDMQDDLSNALGVRYKEVRGWLQNYARKSIDPTYVPKAEDFSISTENWKQFEEVATTYTPIYIDFLVELEKMTRVKRLFNEYDAQIYLSTSLVI